VRSILSKGWFRTMIVCLCRRISDRDITSAVRGGAQCFELLQDQTGVASCCGCCHDCAREVFEAARAQHGVSEAPLSHPVHLVSRAA
jgi:bacterioferritin-associated ferredoxin